MSSHRPIKSIAAELLADLDRAAHDTHASRNLEHIRRARKLAASSTGQLLGLVGGLVDSARDATIALALAAVAMRATGEGNADPLDHLAWTLAFALRPTDPRVPADVTPREAQPDGEDWTIDKSGRIQRRATPPAKAGDTPGA